MKAVDSYIPQPERPIDQPFLIRSKTCSSISGRGTVVTGPCRARHRQGRRGNEIVGLRATQKTIVTGVEMFRKLLDQGQAGDNIGALLRVQARGSRAWPGAVQAGFGQAAHQVQGFGLHPDQGGGRSSHPVLHQLPAQFYFRTTDVTGVVHLPEGTEMVMPGDNISMEVHLIVPIAMEEQLRFAIREGGRTSVPASSPAYRVASQ